MAPESDRVHVPVANATWSPLMDRRTFVKTAGTAAVAAGLPGTPELLRRDRLDKIGLELYTVRDLMKASVERTLSPSNNCLTTTDSVPPRHTSGLTRCAARGIGR